MSTKLSFTPVVSKALKSIQGYNLPEHFKSHKCSTCLNAFWQISSENFPNSGAPEDARNARADSTPLRCYCNATHSYVHLGWFTYDPQKGCQIEGQSPAYMEACDAYDPLTVQEK